MPRPAFASLGLAILCATAAPALSQTDLRTRVAHDRSMRLLERDPTLLYDPTTLLVRFRPGATESDRALLRGSVGGVELNTFPSVPRLELISVTVPVDEAIERLRPYVEYAEPNWYVRADQTIPDDQYFSLQWGMHNTGQDILGVLGTPDADIDGPEAWDVTTGGANFVVAIIDTGTQWSHPDLDANIWSNPGEIAGNGQDDDGNGYVDDVRGWDFYNGDNNPDDSEGHGTHTAGTVGAEGDNGIGVAGMNWQCKMVPLRFLGPFGGSTADAVLAVDYCTTNGIKVSNNSWGGGGFSSSLYNAIDASKSVGHVFCAAAGNSGVNTDSSPHYPSSYDLDNIISVAATDNQDDLADEPTWASNYGAVSVDLGAPGVNIASTYSGSSYVWSSGTSMATPHVAGVAALVYAQNPGWSYLQVVDRILSTARPAASMAGNCVTGGILNAFDAVSGGGGDVTPPADPTGLGATAGDGTVSLDWDDNGEPDLAGYRVYRSTSSGGPYSEIAGLVGSSSYVDNGVTNDTTYYYVVRAEDTSGNLSGNSNEASATPTAGPDVTPPAPPTGLGATAGDGSVSLDWNDNGEGDLAGYRVYRSTSSGGPYSEIAGLLGASSYVDNGVTNGTTYYYVVRAEDTSGNLSGNSNEASATPTAPDVTPPAPPTGLGATAGNGSVSLDWNDNGEGDLAGYNVYRSTSSGGPYTQIAGPLGGSAHVDNGVSNGTTYYYVVTAEDTSGNESGQSNEASATPEGSAGAVHVASITPDTVNHGQGNKQGRAVVVVHDDQGSPVAGAVVFVTFSGDGSGSPSGTTGANGSVTLLSSNIKKGRFNFTVCVTDVQASLPYDSGANVETCDSN